jgi:AbrB family looped-hinge helix DNA binding protein
MTEVKVSPKFQIVIPKEVREALDIRVGQKFRVIQYGNRIELIPRLSVKEARGLFEGINTDVEREPDRE